MNLTWLGFCSLLRKLLRNPVEPDLALHQSLPEPSPQPSPKPSPEPCWTWLGSAPKPPGAFSATFSGTFSETLLNLPGLRNLLRNPLNLTWLCTKSSWNPVEPDLTLRQSLPEPSPEPFPEPCWPEPHLALHQSLPDLLRNLLRTCWTSPCSAPKPPGTFSGTFFGTLLKLCTKASHCRPSPETFSGTFSGTLLTPPGALHQSLPTFSGTFSGTLLNLTWLCTEASWNLLRKLLRNPVEPDLALHQSLPDFLWNLLQNLLRNLVEPDLLCTKSGTLLNVTPAPVHTGAILGWRPP